MFYSSLEATVCMALGELCICVEIDMCGYVSPILVSLSPRESTRFLFKSIVRKKPLPEWAIPNQNGNRRKSHGSRMFDPLYTRYRTCVVYV